MKKCLLVVTVIFALGALTTPGAAQHGPMMGRGMTMPTGAGPAFSEESLKRKHEALLGLLKLPKDKEQKVREVLTAHREKMAAWHKKFDPQIQKLRTRAKLVHSDKSPQGMKAAMTAMSKLGDFRVEEKIMSTGMFGRLKPLLSEQQLAVAQKAMDHTPGMSKPSISEQLLTRLELTDAQRASLRDVMAAHNQALAAWQAANGAEAKRMETRIAALQKLATPEALKEAKDQLKELMVLRAGEGKIKDDLLAKLKGLLGEKQFVVARQIVDPRATGPQYRPPVYLLDRLGLTTAQWKKVQKLLKDGARKAAASGSSAGAEHPMRVAWEKTIKEALTDAQRVKLEIVQREHDRRVITKMLRGVALTDEQFERVRAIQHKAQEKATADYHRRLEFFKQANDEIIEKVLTPTQREAYKKVAPKSWHGSAEHGTSR